ncbi:MAG TPA: UDP-N-acetylglucosamine-1-phosphate transferase [Methanomicrobia archaeon]|nr:UDP-N-acetylglucosamine-1-phosphate transferase [Methanomicrobia archaeon]
MLTGLVLALALNFAFMLLVMPRFIVKLQQRGTVTVDRYKRDLREIPTQGGIAIIAVVFLLFGLEATLEHLPFYFVSIPFQSTDTDWAILLVAGLYAGFGLVDDLVDVGRVVKIVLLFFFSYRLIFVILTTAITIPVLGVIDLGVYHLFIIVPLYVLVVANLVNMHSGFNGLASGLSALLIAFMLVKFIMVGSPGMLVLSCLLGATLGFVWFNRYPARILWGNVGALALGAALGSAIVVSGFLVAGFVMFLPHTVNFLMYAYWRVMHKLHPETLKWQLAKFGRVRDDGTLEVPNPLTLKWVLPYHFRMTERQAVLAMYALTLPFCVLGLFIPY